MDPKKMKIIIAVSIVVNVILVIVMMTLKQGYKEQAQQSVAVSTKAYTDEVARVVNAQNAFIATSNAIWQLVYESLQSTDKSQAAFKLRLATIDKENKLQVKEDTGKVKVSCGKDCNVVFTFTGGQLQSVDYASLASIAPEQEYMVVPPPPFQFKTK